MMKKRKKSLPFASVCFSRVLSERFSLNNNKKTIMKKRISSPSSSNRSPRKFINDTSYDLKFNKAIRYKFMEWQFDSLF